MGGLCIVASFIVGVPVVVLGKKGWIPTRQIAKHLTSHMSRHSFASQALQAGISYAAIKEGLKHGSISTTERYLRSLPSDLIDEEFRSAGF